MERDAKKQEYLIGVAMTRDDEFRAWLVKEPREAARSLGVRLTDREAMFISGLDVSELNKAASGVQAAIPISNNHWGE
jgi:hypothetical protein